MGRRSRVRVHPPLSRLGRRLGELAFEDHLALVVTFDHDLTGPEREEVVATYAAWEARVIAESRAADDGDGDVPPRFDAPTVGPRSLAGGVSRVVAADASCRWLAEELAARPGVVSVAFGEPAEEEAPALPPSDPAPAASPLELVDEGRVVAGLGFAVTLFADHPLQHEPAAVLAAWRAFLGRAPAGGLTRWGTESTPAGRRKSVARSTLGLLERWLEPSAPTRPFLALVIGDGADPAEASRWSFELWSRAEDPGAAHVVHLVVPWPVPRPDELAELARDLFATGAFRSGRVGPCWQFGPVPPVWPRAHTPHAHVVAHADRYPGLGVVHPADEARTVGADGVLGPGWITLVDGAFLRELGPVPTGMAAVPVGSGVALQAAPGPTLDGSLGEAAVHRWLAPALARTVPRTLRWSTGVGEDVQTLTFRLRYAPWPELREARRHVGVAERLLTAARSADDGELDDAFSAVVAALEGLSAVDPSLPASAAPPGAREALVARERARLFQYLGHAASALRDRPARRLALLVAAAALPGAPASVYASLEVRDSPSYVLGGLLQAAVDAGDLEELARHVDAAAGRTSEAPVIHHALTRAFLALGDRERAIDHVVAANASYGSDAASMRDEPALAPLRDDPRFRSAFRRRR